MNMARTELTLSQRLEPLNMIWDFWVTFAWIETRSIDLLETVHGYRTSMSVSNANHMVPVVITEVCNFGCSCDRKITCSLWQATRRKLAQVCADGKLQAYGIPSGSAKPKEIPADEWVFEDRVNEPTDLKIGEFYWSRLSFPASSIIKLFPPLRQPLSAVRPSINDLKHYVKKNVEIGWNMRQICEGAKTHFLPKLPTRRSVENAFKVLVPNPPRGRPPKPNP